MEKIRLEGYGRIFVLNVNIAIAEPLDSRHILTLQSATCHIAPRPSETSQTVPQPQKMTAYLGFCFTFVQIHIIYL